MTEKEMIKVSIEEFSRLQDYMEECDKGFLQISGVNLTEIDRIKE